MASKTVLNASLGAASNVSTLGSASAGSVVMIFDEDTPITTLVERIDKHKRAIIEYYSRGKS